MRNEEMANNMDQVVVKYKKVRFKLFIRKIYNYIVDRLRGGIVFEIVKFSILNFFKNLDFISLKKMFYSILIYCLSGTVVKNLIGINVFEEELFPLENLFTESNKRFCHWAPKDKLNNIFKEGLFPGKNRKYVYITDDSESLKNRGYFLYKTLNTCKKDMVFVRIDINITKLLEEYKVFKIIRKHEYIVEKVSPDCLIKH